MDELRSFTFGAGAHKTRDDGMCVMEAAAFLAGEGHTDSPECACPIITYIAQRLNDNCHDQLRNSLLRDLPWRVIGTRDNSKFAERAEMVCGWIESRMPKGSPDFRGGVDEYCKLGDVGLAANLLAIHVTRTWTMQAVIGVSRISERSARATHQLLDALIKVTEPQERACHDEPAYLTSINAPDVAERAVFPQSMSYEEKV